jgi:hypothetical protein
VRGFAFLRLHVRYLGPPSRLPQKAFVLMSSHELPVFRPAGVLSSVTDGSRGRNGDSQNRSGGALSNCPLGWPEKKSFWFPRCLHQRRCQGSKVCPHGWTAGNRGLSQTLHAKRTILPAIADLPVGFSVSESLRSCTNLSNFVMSSGNSAGIMKQFLVAFEAEYTLLTLVAPWASHKNSSAFGARPIG